MKVSVFNTTVGDVEYSIYGKGDPILFLHGGHSNAKEKLAHKNIDPNKFTLITPSRPGYGNTSIAENKTPIDSAKQIIELMDELKFSKFDVIGVSAGGLTAIALVSLYPEKINKFILASAISKRWLSSSDELYRRGKKLFNPQVEKYTWGILKFFLRIIPKMIITKMASELSTIKVNRISKVEINDMKEFLLNSRSGSGFITDLEQDLEEKIIQDIKVPTLIIHSRNDKAVGLEHPLNASEKIVNSKLVWLDNDWGHMIWFDKDATHKINSFLLD